MDLQGKVCRVSPQELVSFIYAYVPASWPDQDTWGRSGSRKHLILIVSNGVPSSCALAGNRLLALSPRPARPAYKYPPSLCLASLLPSIGEARPQCSPLASDRTQVPPTQLCSS